MIETLERQLRAARQLVFSEDTAIADQAARDIVRLKRELVPLWDKAASMREPRPGTRAHYNYMM